MVKTGGSSSENFFILTMQTV